MYYNGALGYIVGGLIGCVIFGCITKYINNSKGYEGGFAWGFWLNLIGVIVVACKPENRSESQKVKRHTSVSESYIDEKIKTAHQIFSDGNYESARKAYESILQFFSHDIDDSTFNEIETQIRRCSEYINCSSDSNADYSGRIKCQYCGAYNSETNSSCFHCGKPLRITEAKSQTEVTIQNASSEPIALIKQLADLHSQGILTDEEFETKKTELLAKM